MSFFSDFVDKVKEKKADLDDRRAFQNMVDDQAKPIRRASYMQQMLKESVAEGIAKAKIDAQKRLPKEKKGPADFGIEPKKDQWAFLDNIGIVKENDKTLTKNNRKKK
jgi:hypothetical protein